MPTHIRKESGVAIVEPSGRVMGTSAIELRKAIEPEIEVAETPRILINFEKVNMIDSSGLGALMEARALATQKNGRIGVVNVSKQIKNLIAINRIMSMFEHFDSEDAAVSELSA